MDDKKFNEWNGYEDFKRKEMQRLENEYLRNRTPIERERDARIQRMMHESPSSSDDGSVGCIAVIVVLLLLGFGGCIIIV